jgi:tetratricopeptide (TPR) repeat protein
MTFSAEPNRKARELFQDGQLQPALELCEQVLRADTLNFDALYLAGLIAVQLRQPELAVARFDRALGLDPGNAAAHCNKAVALQALGARDAALASYDTAIRINSDYALAINNRGNVLVELQRCEEALDSYDRAISIRPDYTSAHFGRANALQILQKFTAAIEAYDATLALNPDYVEAHCNRGAALAALNRLPEALAGFDAAIALRPEFAEAHFGKAVTLLLSGEFGAGWTEYEWRPQSLRTFERPRWRGNEAIAGKKLLVYCERGLGDSLQYCRYAKLLSDLQATVILQVQDSLAEVLKNLAGTARVIGVTDPLPDYDYHCPLLSLPFVFKTNLKSIPAPNAYLRAAPERTAHWRTRLASAPGVRIGLVWRGDPRSKDDLKRSMPLTTMLQLLPPQLQYISLQRDIGESERATLKGLPAVKVLCDVLDFVDTAAVCECLDLVVSVDTSVAHLSAGLGKRTWILLPFNPDCRWLLDRSDSPWYPSVTLYRQPQLHDWHAPLTRIAADLRREFLEPQQGPLRMP